MSGIRCQGVFGSRGFSKSRTDIPMVIGGGHNNSFPLLKAVSQTLGYPQGIACLNCDAHADFQAVGGPAQWQRF